MKPLPLALFAFLVACSEPLATSTSLSDVRIQTADLSKQIGQSAARIQGETKELRPITADRPAAGPHLDSIDAESAKLRGLSDRLDLANADLARAEKDSQTKDAQIAALQKQTAKLKEEAKSALDAKLNALIVTFSVLLGLSFLLVWFAGPKGFVAPLGCGGVIVALLTVKVAVLYAVWIAAGAGVCIVAALAYYAYQHRQLRSLVNAPEPTGK